jgi:hypothetical protein
MGLLGSQRIHAGNFARRGKSVFAQQRTEGNRPQTNPALLEKPTTGELLPVSVEKVLWRSHEIILS